jgi:hypothetical protein
MSTLNRPRYTLCNSRSAFRSQNFDSLPFEIIKPMVWDKTKGFTELLHLKRPPLQIYTVVDWKAHIVGAIYQVNVKLTKPEYYFWVYGPEPGADKQPHVDECYWVRLKEGLV